MNRSLFDEMYQAVVSLVRTELNEHRETAIAKIQIGTRSGKDYNVLTKREHNTPCEIQKIKPCTGWVEISAPGYWLLIPYDEIVAISVNFFDREKSE